LRPKNKEGTGRPNIVIPSIRDNDFFYGFLESWKLEFAGCHIIVIEDRQIKRFSDIMKEHSKLNNYTYELYDWKDIDDDLSDDAWIISRNTDCVRNYGYLMAYKNDPLFIATLDDDLIPWNAGHIKTFYNRLFEPITQNPNYFSTMNVVLPRGKLLSPEELNVAIVHGTWTNVPDLDAKTQIASYNGPTRTTAFYDGVIPFGCLFSMCGMNLAWNPSITKWMYFPLMGKSGGYPIDRCGDIWAGYYAKHNCDKQNLVCVTGAPFADHNRASNMWTNLIKEKNADEMGSLFIKFMQDGKITGKFKKYFAKLKVAYNIWEKLLSEYTKNV